LPKGSNSARILQILTFNASPSGKTRLKKRILQFVLAFGVAGLLLWRVGPAQLARALVSAQVLPVALAFLIVIGAVAIKAYRFRLLVRRRLPVRRLFRIAALQDALNAFLPARLGELSYLVMLRREGIPAGEGMASLALARVGDLIAANVVFYIALAVLGDTGLHLGAIILPAAVIFLGALIGVVVVAFFRDRVNLTADRLMAFIRLPERLRDAVRQNLSHLLSGLRAGRDRRLFIGAFSCSILVWIAAALALHLWIIALGARLSFWSCALVQTLLAILSLLPIHALLGPAVVEASLLGLLVLLGIEERLAMTIVLASVVYLAVYYALILPISVAIAPTAHLRATEVRPPSSECPSR